MLCKLDLISKLKNFKNDSKHSLVSSFLSKKFLTIPLKRYSKAIVINFAWFAKFSWFISYTYHALQVF